MTISSSRTLNAAVLSAAVALAGASLPSTGRACPFCSAAMQTLGQEIASADGAVIAQLVKPMPASSPGELGVEGAVSSAKFRILEVLRGEEKLAGATEIDVVYFGDDSLEKKFLITGLAAITPDKIEWTTPVPLSDRAVAYIKQLPSLPESGVERLVYFQTYLEDEDRLLAQDSYDEFARAPYADVIALKPHMKRESLLRWINDPNVGPSGRRLYLTMLGICGQPEDIAMLEEFLQYDYQLMKPGLATTLGSAAAGGMAVGAGMIDEMVHASERRKKESLDALIACYLKLKGPEGLALVNEKFFANLTVEYKHLHSAIMALRFHGEETDVLPREKLLESMRLALDHKEFADQVIPDLTRWEDWEVMPRLVTMFKESAEDDWIRQPVASYMLVAEEQPGDVGARGKAALAELADLDAETIERAKSLSAFSFLAKAANSTTATPPADSGASPNQEAASPGVGEAAAPAAATEPQDRVAASTPGAAPAPVQSAAADPAPTASQTAAAPKTAKSEAVPAKALPIPGTLKIVGVPLAAGLVLLAIFAVLLRGTDPRSSQETPDGAGRR